MNYTSFKLYQLVVLNSTVLNGTSFKQCCFEPVSNGACFEQHCFLNGSTFKQCCFEPVSNGASFEQCCFERNQSNGISFESASFQNTGFEEKQKTMCAKRYKAYIEKQKQCICSRRPFSKQDFYQLAKYN